jgi:hypothetical protein
MVDRVVRRVVMTIIVVVVAGGTILTVVQRTRAGANVSDVDRTYVVVLARHVRHEAALAAAAETRASDPAGRDLAADVTRRASARADELDALVRRWGIDDASAADPVTITGVPVFSCSLQHRPVDDLGQINAAIPTEVSARWAQLAMTSAIEGRNLSKTTEARLVAARDVAVGNDRWHREVLASLAPLLPETDRAMVQRAQVP